MYVDFLKWGIIYHLWETSVFMSVAGGAFFSWDSHPRGSLVIQIQEDSGGKRPWVLSHSRVFLGGRRPQQLEKPEGHVDRAWAGEWLSSSSQQWGWTLLHPGEPLGGKAEWSCERRQKSESVGGGAERGPRGPWRGSLTVLRSRAAEEDPHWPWTCRPSQRSRSQCHQRASEWTAGDKLSLGWRPGCVCVCVCVCVLLGSMLRSPSS